MAAKIAKTDSEWRAQLTPLQYNVTRRRGTERAFSAQLPDIEGAGVYRCICCDAALFSSESRVGPEKGWPCFRAPIDPGCIATREDYSWLRRRIEAQCAACDAHLGHVVDDASLPAGRGYVVNSVALRFAARNR